MSFAQPVVTAELDSAYVETGNPCIIHILAPKAEGQYFALDLAAWDSVVQKENILATKGPVLNEKRQAYEMEINLLLFDEDTLYLPPVRVQYENGNWLLSNPLTLIIRSTPAPDDLNDMRDIGDIRREPIHVKDLLPWVLGIGGAIGLILALFFWYARKNKKQFVRHRHLEKSPKEQAMARLHALSQKRMWQQGKIKPYYDTLTAIFREFLEKQHQIPALESSSTEWLAMLHKMQIFEVSEMRFAEELMHNADLAKFAKGEPSADFHEKAWQGVYDWIMAERD